MSSGFPFILNCRLKYCLVNINLTGTGIVPSWHIMYSNSLYSPEFVGGHQPYYRDQLATLYERYQVFGVTLIVRGFVGSTNAIVTIGHRAGTVTQPVTISECEENPRYAVMYCTDQRPIKFTKYYNIARLNNQTTAQYSADSLNNAAYQGFNPLNPSVIDIGVASHDGGGTVGMANLRIEMIYHARMFQAVTVAPS